MTTWPRYEMSHARHVHRMSKEEIRVYCVCSRGTALPFISSAIRNFHLFCCHSSSSQPRQLVRSERLIKYFLSTISKLYIRNSHISLDACEKAHMQGEQQSGRTIRCRLDDESKWCDLQAQVPAPTLIFAILYFTFESTFEIFSSHFKWIGVSLVHLL